MYRSLAVLILVVCLLLTSTAVAEDSGRIKPKKSTTGAVLRSLAVPGWGQLYNESYVKSAALFVTETLLVVGVSRYNDWMQAAKTADNFVDEQLFRSARNKNIWWFAAVKLLSLGDAYVDAQLYKIDISPSLTPEGTDGMKFGATIRF